MVDVITFTAILKLWLAVMPIIALWKADSIILALKK
jgi:hypothetical protein